VHRLRRRRLETGRLEMGVAVGDLGMQLGDGAGLAPQRRDLADHVHALAPLCVLVDAYELGALAPEALRPDAQPSEVELLERLPHPARRDALGLEPRALGGEGADVVGVDAARRVAGRGVEERGPLAAYGGLLERGLDGAAGDGLVGEEVGGAGE